MQLALALPLLAGPASGTAQGQQCRPGQDPGAVVWGSVVDRATRVPLQQASVQLAWTDRERKRTQRTETDSTGRYRFCRVRTDQLLELRADFYGEAPLQRVQAKQADSLTVELEVEAPHSVLRGRVLAQSGDVPVASAHVQLLDTPLATATGADGAFTFAQLPPGEYRVRIEHLGFGTRTDSLEVDFRSTVSLEARLATEPVRLAPLVVNVESHVLLEAGFYERRAAGLGAFLTRREWEDQNPLHPSDVLRSVAGVRIVPGASMMETVITDRASCPMRYFMDGARLNPTFQLDQIDVQWIEALEVYRGPSEVPGQFRGFSSSERGNCGVIVIWTRRNAH